MGYDPKTGLHRCDLCERAMNSGADLTDLWKPGAGGHPLRICSSKQCWDKAKERGYPTVADTDSGTTDPE